ncbi:uncharacterized protein J3D65DRAFT_238721 [Phyllosticta citribraziliensis]|uniref:Uncharacterized protein n=1 Tax=Phyllosticta citribraziliensis TaxID=989973 RepID=A0ABR1LZ99_9PEZI
MSVKALVLFVCSTSPGRKQNSSTSVNHKSPALALRSTIKFTFCLPCPRAWSGIVGVKWTTTSSSFADQKNNESKTTPQTTTPSPVTLPSRTTKSSFHFLPLIPDAIMSPHLLRPLNLPCTPPRLLFLRRPPPRRPTYSAAARRAYRTTTPKIRQAAACGAASVTERKRNARDGESVSDAAVGRAEYLRSRHALGSVDGTATMALGSWLS